MTAMRASSRAQTRARRSGFFFGGKAENVPRPTTRDAAPHSTRYDITMRLAIANTYSMILFQLRNQRSNTVYPQSSQEKEISEEKSDRSVPRPCLPCIEFFFLTQFKNSSFPWKATKNDIVERGAAIRSSIFLHLSIVVVSRLCTSSLGRHYYY
jgi:hypothetical protein